MSETGTKILEIRLVIDGDEVTKSVDELCRINDTDLDEEMRKAAPDIAYWGAVLADAQEALDTLDTEYRVMRARKTQELLASEPKLAEWKVKAAIESLPEFEAIKSRIAAATRSVGVLWSVYTSMQHKSELIRSVGARKRSELDATGMSTPTSEKAARHDKVADALKRKKV